MRLIRSTFNDWRTKTKEELLKQAGELDYDAEELEMRVGYSDSHDSNYGFLSKSKAKSRLKIVLVESAVMKFILKEMHGMDPMDDRMTPWATQLTGEEIGETANRAVRLELGLGR